MSGGGRSDKARPRKSRGALRVLETVAVWLAILGLFAVLGYGAWLAARDGLAQLDHHLKEAPTRDSEVLMDEPVVAPGIGAPPEVTTQDGTRIVASRWLVLPKPIYPRTGSEMVASSVELSCQVDAEGRLTSCEVLEETPEGQGFGAAAVEAAMNARLSPRMENGEATAGQIQFTIRFQP